MKKKYKVHESHFSVFMYVYISPRSVFGSASTGHNRQVSYRAGKPIYFSRVVESFLTSTLTYLLIFTSCSYTDSNHGPHYVHIRTCMRSVPRTFLLRSIACSLFSSRSISLYHRSSPIPSSRYIPGSFLSLLHCALLFAPWSKSHAFPHVCLMLTLYLAHALRALVC